MKKFSIILSLSILLFSTAYAQKQWSLNECVEQALANNISIMQQKLTTDYQENLLDQSKYNRLPNLSANVNQSFGFGRSLDYNNLYVSTSSSNTGFGINTSMSLWQGGRLKNQVVQQELELKSSLENLEQAKQDLKVNIAQGYLEVLYAEELLKVAKEQLGQTEIQIIRTQSLVDAGKLAEGVLLEIKSQAARENLAIVEGRNRMDLALLNLAQMLGLSDYSGFGIQTPQLPEIKAESALIEAKVVFESALDFRPEIKSATYQVESSEVELKMAKAGYLPSLTASAGFYDQYYVASIAAANPAFSQQVRDNGRSNIGLNLSIPLFSRMQNKTNVQNSKIQIESRQLDLEAVKLQLRKQIEQAYLNARSSFESYHANKVAEESMQESFRYMEQKFELGRVNSVEYNEAKTNLTRSQSDLIQAKYEFIFRSKILDFYKGIPIVF